MMGDNVTIRGPSELGLLEGNPAASLAWRWHRDRLVSLDDFCARAALPSTRGYALGLADDLVGLAERCLHIRSFDALWAYHATNGPL